MHLDRMTLSARRQTARISNMVEQSMNRTRDINSLQRERNQGAADQVRNIGGTIRTDIFAYFGLGNGGNFVGP